MKRYLYYILILLFSGCFSETGKEKPDYGTEELVKINVISPRIATKSDSESGNYINMPANSTIRLFIYKEGVGLQTNPHPSNLVKEVTLRVLGDEEGGSGGTILCNVDNATGKPLGDITDSDIHLPASLYTFYAISPAIKLSNQMVPDYTVLHGDTTTLRTTRSKTYNIGYQGDPITGGTPGFFNLRFDPLTLLTSRLSFKLEMGEKVDMLRVEARGMEITNLATNAYIPNFLLGYQELEPMDVVGSGQVRLRYKKAEHTDAENPDSHFFVTQVIPNKPGEYKDVELRFHLLVNGNNYKAYVAILPQQRFDRGISYNYNVKVNVGGVFITGWTSNNWETAITN